jgi:hypothetical protein
MIFFWRLLGWLFNKKPKALLPFEDTFLASYQKEREELRKQARKREKEEQKAREQKEKKERKKREAMAKLEAEGAKEADVKRAFDHIGKVLAQGGNMDIGINGNILSLDKDQFKAFRIPFIALCQTMGIKAACNTYSDWIMIDWESAVAYKDSLGKQTSKSIITSAYR